MVKSASQNLLRVSAASKFRSDGIANVPVEVQQVLIELVPGGDPTDNFAIDFNQKKSAGTRPSGKFLPRGSPWIVSRISSHDP